MCTEQTIQVICMFLRDSGETTPLNEMEVRLTFSKFTSLLLNIEQYTVLKWRPGWRKTLSCKDFLEYLQAMPPSKRCDVIARKFFPVIMVMQYVVFQAILPLY